MNDNNDVIIKFKKNTRKNKKSDISENTLNTENIPTAKKNCPRGTRKNKFGNCVSKVTDQIIGVDTIQSSTTISQPIIAKNKYCIRGTRKNKDGICVPIITETEFNPKTVVFKVKKGTLKRQIERKTKEDRPNSIENIIQNKSVLKENRSDDRNKDQVVEDDIDDVVEDDIDDVEDDIGDDVEDEDEDGDEDEDDNENENRDYKYDEYEDEGDIQIVENDIEMNNFKYNQSNDDYDFLYPDLDDPHFNIKIAKKKEFNDTQYDGTIYGIKEQSEILCNIEFELMPHQLFVKNFLSLQTPYSSLFLYHGLGTGKTCSAIGIAEEMRSYIKQIGLEMRKSSIMVDGSVKNNQHIIVVAAPNVQMNFRMQLFDPSKLKKNESTGEWNINSCVGKSLLNEINPAHIKGMSKERIERNMNKIISSSYRFYGYEQFAKYALKRIKKEYSNEKKNKSAKLYFSNKLIIIDEVHNIRTEEGNRKKVVTDILFQIVRGADNVRLLLLSATPMYNSYKEIIWITNLLNANDRRRTIKTKEVFDDSGNFVVGGRELLQRKLTGYVSYVRGENPYTFPYRIYPDTFDPSSTFSKINVRPTIQLNDSKEILDPIQIIQPYLTKMHNYQETEYLQIIDEIKSKGVGNRLDESAERFGYETLLKPILALNIIYPPIIGGLNVGKDGLNVIMDMVVESPISYSYKYKRSVIEQYGRIFSKEHIHKYSSKISKICDIVLRSTGTILIYSQYIDGGLIPMALALEEMGISRFGTTPNTLSLLSAQTPRVEPIDSIHLKRRSQINVSGHKFKSAKYMMITGNKNLSLDNTKDLAYFNNSENKYGANVKVVLISKAGAEGLDFKNVRQIHIMEPWYNMNRVEQIIGRGVRNLSHCNLKFEERNVEIYLHATIIENKARSNEECADLYIYRMAERKSITMGNVTRLLKETSVDCLLNVKQTNFTVEKLNALVSNKKIVIRLSTDNIEKEFMIGDRPFTVACDYKDKCELLCRPTANITNDKIVHHTYSQNFIGMNNIRISDKIRQLFVKNHFYSRKEIIELINDVKPYPIEQIYSALTLLVNDKNDLLVDSYGRTGILENKGDIYIFKPIEISDTNSSLYEHISPVELSQQSLRINLDNELLINKEHSTFEKLMQMVKENDQIVFGVKKDTYNVYYTNLQRIKGRLENVHGVSLINIKKYAVHHFLDTMLVEDKLTICKNMFQVVDKHRIDDELENIVHAYFEERIILYRNIRHIIVTDGVKNVLYRLPNFTTQHHNDDDEEIIRKLRTSKLSETYIGFFEVDLKKSKIPAFKTKNMAKKNPKSNLLQGKGKILTILNAMTIELEGTKEYGRNIAPYTDESTTKSSIKVTELIVLLEIIMRETQAKIPKKEYSSDKYVFLSPEETTFMFSPN